MSKINSQVKHIIAVASAKGGVGKSTVAVNLALALAKDGAHIGILDADIYGPSIPTMLGAQGAPESIEGKFLTPVISYGIQTMSIAYLVEDHDTPMVWRGPIASRALQQLLNDTLWQDLDYLLVDMPPGTGDIQLTMAQKVPLDGAVIVTTPQGISLVDARRGVRMFEKVNVPILGIIENMATYQCSACGHHEAIFDELGGQVLAQEYGSECLASIPLVRSIREQTDRGFPTVLAESEGELSQLYGQAANRLIANLAKCPKPKQSKFPKIIVENK